MATFTTSNETGFAEVYGGAVTSLLTAIALVGSDRKTVIEVAERKAHAATVYAHTTEESLMAARLSAMIEDLYEQRLDV